MGGESAGVARSTNGKHTIGTTVSYENASEQESGASLQPHELILALLVGDERLQGLATQRTLARTALLSQPSVSRLLRTLQERGIVAPHFPGPWEGAHVERTYRLTPKGETLGRALWTRILKLPTPNPLLELQDLFDLHPHLPRADLLILCLRKAPFDVEHPEPALAQLEGKERGPASMSDSAPSPRSGPVETESLPLVGRVRERRRLLSVLRGVIGVHVEPASVVLLGPAGIGKSTLLRFAERVAEERGFQVRRGQLASGNGLPGYLLGDFIDPSLTRTARPTAAALPKLMVTLLERLEQEARKKPQLIVVDDVDRAPVEDLTLLEFLLFHVLERRMPVVFLLGVRDDEPKGSRSEAVLAHIHRLGRTGTGLLRLEPVPPLSPEEAHLLAQRAVGNTAAGLQLDPLFKRIEARARGNPLFLLETIACLRHRGLLDPDRVAELDAAPLPVPDGLQRLIEDRIGHLPESARQLLSMAAAVGTEFGLEPIVALSKEIGAGERTNVRTMLERELAQGEFLETRGVGEFAFRHPLVPEVLEMQDQGRRRFHLFLAGWWSTHAPEEVEVIAGHYHEANDPVGGIPWVKRALQAAVASHSLERVERYHHWLQDLMVSGGVSAEVRAREGLGTFDDLWGAMGPTPAGVRILHALRSLHPSPPLRREVAVRLAFHLARTDPSAAQRMIKMLGQEASRERTPGGAVVPLLSLVRTRIANTQGRDREVLKETAPLLSAMDKLPVWARGYVLYYAGQAWRYFDQGPRVRDCLAQARALARSSGSLFLQGLGHNLEAALANSEGRVRLQRRAFESALTVAQASGDLDIIATRLANLAQAFLMEGDLSRSRQTLEEHHRFCERFGVVAEPGLELKNWADLTLREGHWEEAIALLQKAREAMTRAGRTYLLDAVRFTMIDALLLGGDATTARQELRSARYEDSLRLAQDGWCRVLEDRAPSARTLFERAVTKAEARSNLLDQGKALCYLSRWEAGFGDPERARSHRRMAQARFDRAGVIRGGWYRSWPPPFAGAQA